MDKIKNPLITTKFNKQFKRVRQLMFNQRMECKRVAIGGGTGLSTLLRGLKQYLPNRGSKDKGLYHCIEQLTAIVTVTDDGGSSGKLRRELQVLPPGDIRNCMLALAEDEALMTQLFKYRFAGNGHLQGHSFGNLFLAAMTSLAGNFLEAIQFASEVLAIKGCIYPSTVDDVHLTAELDNGKCIRGESSIAKSGSRIKRLCLEPKKPKALPQAISAIHEADIITIGPGSLFTSILPNLLVPGIADAISLSNAQKIFICNVMTEPGETDGFNELDHLQVILQYAPQIHFDSMLVNSTLPPQEKYKEYVEKGYLPVINCIADKGLTYRLETFNDHAVKIYHCDLLDENTPTRHRPDKLAAKVMELTPPIWRQLAQIA